MIKFTHRQEQVFSILIAGNTYQQIADKLGIKKTTVDGHLRRIYRKMGAHSAVEAFRKACKLGLIPPSMPE